MKHTLSFGITACWLTLAASAQTASYTLFGEGCNGAPVGNCLTLNDVNPTHLLASLPNEYAYPVQNTTGVPIQVVGFEIYTVTNTGLQQVGKTGILYDLSGPGATVFTRPAPDNTANGTITVDNTVGWYSTSVYPPMTFQPNEVFWLHADAYSLIAPPQHVTGGAAGPVANWYRRPSNGMIWTSSVSVARQIFRVHCLPAVPSVPTLTATSLPQFGTTLSLQITGGPALAPGFMIYAIDRTQWQSFPTPVDLGLVGAPGCALQTSSDVLDLVLLDALGQGSSQLAIPASPLLGGFTFYNQSAVLSPANQLGVLLGNAGTAVVGN